MFGWLKLKIEFSSDSNLVDLLISLRALAMKSALRHLLSNQTRVYPESLKDYLSSASLSITFFNLSCRFSNLTILRCLSETFLAIVMLLARTYRSLLEL